MATMKKRTIPTKLKTEGAALWSKAQILKIKAAKLRAIVDGFKTKLLKSAIFLDQYSGERILDPKYDWLMEESVFLTYWKAVEDELNVKGLREGLESGQCPALIAENEVIKVNREIIEWTAKTIGEGKEFIDGVYSNMKYYHEALDLFDQLHGGKI